MELLLNNDILKELGVLVPDDSTKKEYEEVEKLTRYYRKKVIYKLFGDNEYSKIPVRDLKFPIRFEVAFLVDVQKELLTWENNVWRCFLCTPLFSYFRQENLSTEIMEYIPISIFSDSGITCRYNRCKECFDLFVFHQQRLSNKYYVFLKYFSEQISIIVFHFLFNIRNPSGNFRKLQWKYAKKQEKYQRLRNIMTYHICKQLHNRNIRESKKNIIPFIELIPRLAIITSRYREYNYEYDDDDDDWTIWSN